MDVRGKSAVVTGGASGIGRGILYALAEAGASGAVVADVDEHGGTALARELSERGINAHFKACDVTSEAAVEELAEFSWDSLGGVDLLFNNAGVTAPGDSLEATDADIRWELDVNVMGVAHGTRMFGRRFLAGGTKAWICNTASHNALGAPFPNVAGYVASKHAALGYTDAMRRQYGDRIGFSVVCPGPVRTAVWDAGRARPERFGGPTSGDPRNEQFLADEGVDADEVGRAVIAGIIAEAFIILTDPSDVEIARRRFEEVRAAVVRQFPGYNV